MYNSESLHGSTPYQVDHYDSTSIFVQPLYGSLQLPDIHRLTGTTGCVHQLWETKVPRTVNVQIRKLAWQHTIPSGSLWCYKQFCTPAVWIFMALSRTSPYGYHRLCTQIMSSRKSLTAGVQFHKLAWQYTIPRIAVTLKAFFTPAVQICTAPWRTSPNGYHRCCLQIMSFRGILTAGVRFRKSAWQYNTPKRALTCKRHFRTPSVLICRLSWRTSPYGYHRLCT